MSRPYTTLREESGMTATMMRREWQSMNKSTWGSGAWQDESDKVQWVDEATGLDCLMVRSLGGHWCGYVGVAEGHPWFGLGYSGCLEHCGESWCGHSPASRI